MPLVRIPPSFAVPQLQLRGSHRAMQSRLTLRFCCMRQSESGNGRGRCRPSASGKPENGAEAVAADCKGIRSLESGELYRRLLGLIVFLGNMFIPALAHCSAKHELSSPLRQCDVPGTT